MACWVGLSVFALLKMCQQHEIHNMRASMLRERQKLINEGMSSSDKFGRPGKVDSSNNVTSPEKF